MKQIILPLLVIIASSTVGQNYFGVKAGLNITDLAPASSTHLDPAFRMSGGLTLERFLGDKYSFGTELLFNQRGYRSTVQFSAFPGPGTFDVHYNFNYLSVPVKVSRWFGSERRVFGAVGLVPSLLLRAQAKIKDVSSGGQLTYDRKQNIEDVKPLDLAGQLESGVNVPLGTKYCLFGSVAFQYSITSNNEEPSFFQDKVRHYGVMISGGIRIKLRDN